MRAFERFFMPAWKVRNSNLLVSMISLDRVKKKVSHRKNLNNSLLFLAAAATKSLQSCLTLCDPMDCGPPGSSVQGILQARTLEWVAISFSSA